MDREFEAVFEQRHYYLTALAGLNVAVGLRDNTNWRGVLGKA
jgi:hypothetical protein